MEFWNSYQCQHDIYEGSGFLNLELVDTIENCDHAHLVKK